MKGLVDESKAEDKLGEVRLEKEELRLGREGKEGLRPALGRCGW